MKDYLKQPARDREFLEHIHARAGLPQERVRSALYDMIYLRFSKAEVFHLALATVLVTAVGMSIFGNFPFSIGPVRWELIAIFISAFIIHELGHKFLAQFYRAWAEFRVLFFGAVITTIAIFLPFKFIAPGVVWVSGNLSRSRSGRVSWIGPLTNLAMGTGFLVSYLILAAVDSANPTLLVGVWFNGWIAFFNLIPFMGLDGQKIFGWNKLVWLLTMAAAVGLFIGGDLLGGGRTMGFLGRFF